MCMRAMLGPSKVYAMLMDYRHGNVESVQNTFKGHPMKIQKSFRCGLG
jgi:hypothetical protein